MNLFTKLKNNPRVLRYGLVGIINTAIDFGLLFLLKSLGLPVVIANISSTGTAFIFSFFANKKYTFKTSGTSIIREMVLFVAVTLFGLWVLQTIIIDYSLDLINNVVHNLNISLLIAKLIATAVSMVWNYVLYSKLVFVEANENNRPEV